VYSFLLISTLAANWRRAVRWVFGIVVIYAYCTYLPSFRNYSKLVGDSLHQSQQVIAAQRQVTSVNPAQLQVQPTNAASRPPAPVNVAPAEPQPVNTTRQPKLSATALEIVLQREPQFKPENQVRCKAATRGWDYTCSYMPAPVLSPTRVQFGIRVDATRWVERSRVVPPGTIIPRPQKRATGDAGS
jgi:hypothetical protein